MPLLILKYTVCGSMTLCLLLALGSIHITLIIQGIPFLYLFLSASLTEENHQKEDLQIPVIRVRLGTVLSFIINWYLL